MGESVFPAPFKVSDYTEPTPEPPESASGPSPSKKRKVGAVPSPSPAAAAPPDAHLSSSRLQSTLRLRQAWAEISHRHESAPSTGVHQFPTGRTRSLREDDDDIIDLGSMELVQDRGVLRRAKPGGWAIGSYAGMGPTPNLVLPNGVGAADGEDDDDDDEEEDGESNGSGALWEEMDDDDGASSADELGDWEEVVAQPSVQYRDKRRKYEEERNDLRQFLLDEARLRLTTGDPDAGSAAEELVRRAADIDASALGAWPLPQPDDHAEDELAIGGTSSERLPRSSQFRLKPGAPFVTPTKAASPTSPEQPPSTTRALRNDLDAVDIFDSSEESSPAKTAVGNRSTRRSPTHSLINPVASMSSPLRQPPTLASSEPELDAVSADFSSKSYAQYRGRRLRCERDGPSCSRCLRRGENCTYMNDSTFQDPYPSTSFSLQPPALERGAPPLPSSAPVPSILSPSTGASELPTSTPSDPLRVTPRRPRQSFSVVIYRNPSTPSLAKSFPRTTSTPAISPASLTPRPMAVHPPPAANPPTPFGGAVSPPSSPPVPATCMFSPELGIDVYATFASPEADIDPFDVDQEEVPGEPTSVEHEAAKEPDTSAGMRVKVPKEVGREENSDMDVEEELLPSSKGKGVARQSGGLRTPPNSRPINRGAPYSSSRSLAPIASTSRLPASPALAGAGAFRRASLPSSSASSSTSSSSHIPPISRDTPFDFSRYAKPSLLASSPRRTLSTTASTPRKPFSLQQPTKRMSVGPSNATGLATPPVSLVGGGRREREGRADRAGNPMAVSPNKRAREGEDAVGEDEVDEEEDPMLLSPKKEEEEDSASWLVGASGGSVRRKARRGKLGKGKEKVVMLVDEDSSDDELMLV